MIIADYGASLSHELNIVNQDGKSSEIQENQRSHVNSSSAVSTAVTIVNLCRFLSDKYSSILLIFSDWIQLAMYNSIIPHTKDHHFVVRLNSLSTVFLFNRYEV